MIDTTSETKLFGIIGYTLYNEMHSFIQKWLKNIIIPQFMKTLTKLKLDHKKYYDELSDLFSEFKI